MTLGIALSLFLGCDHRAVQLPAGGHEVARIGVQAVNGASPAYGIRQVVAMLSQEGLTASSSDGRSRPRLADHWTTSSDGLTWRFTLRPNIKFHDGTPVTSALVKASLERAVQQGNASAFPMKDIAAIEAPSPSELVIKLSSPSSFLLDDLWVPITKSQPGSPIGTGPFSVSSVSANGAVMHANDSYYLGPPRIDGVVIRPYASLRSAWADMLRGDVDFLYEVGSDALDFVNRSSSVRVFKAERPYNYVVFLNQHLPVLKSPVVRRALNLGIDREQLVKDGLAGHGRPQYSPVWPDNWAYDNRGPRFEYKPELAVELLKQSNLKVVQKQDGEEPPSRLTITCLVPQNRAAVERLALVVQAQLSQLGINFQLESVSPNDFITRVTSGKFEAAIIDAVAGPSLAFTYWSWHSRAVAPAGFNYEGYSSPEVDSYLDTIRHATSDGTYRQAVSGLQRAMYNDPPAIFLAWSETFRAVSRRFDVPETESGDLLPSMRLWTPASPVSTQ